MALSSKTSARIATVQAIYATMIDSNFGNLKAQKDLLSYYKNQEDGQEIPPPNKGFFNMLLNIVIEEIDVLDKIITGYLTKDWTFDKLSLILVSILRCGIAEVIYVKKTPTKVVINEYTNITASFFDLKETGFVNSVLDKVAAEYRQDKV